MTINANDPGFGVYLHWPYCTRICPYCDFNVYAAKSRNTAPLVEAFENDLRAHRARFGRKTVTSIYFGGGTPSLLSAGQVETLIERIVREWDIDPEPEITLEANPNDLNKQKLTDLRSAGINRLSIGVQSLNDEALTFLGREHTAADARRAAGTALAILPSVSVDLIYALPGQCLTEWTAELNATLDLGAQHLSLYELTIEERTAFGKAVSRGEWTPMEEDSQAALYELTNSITSSRGLPAYEISNHARDRKFQSRHNLTYWRGGDWVGIGPGAHGRVTHEGHRLALAAYRRPAEYIDSVVQSGTGIEEDEALTPSDWANETLIMGLRSTEGVSVQRLEALAGQPITQQKLSNLHEDDWIALDGDTIRLTHKGRLLADQIGSQLAF